MGSPVITPDIASSSWKAAVHAQMLGTTPSYAYENQEEISTQLQERGGDDFDKGFGYAVETGFEETPLGMLLRGKPADPFQSHSILGNFIHDTVSVASDPLFLIPTIVGSIYGAPQVGAAAGFALDAGTRKALMDHYQKGDVKSFGELADRAGDALWAATKGAAVGEAGMLAGDLPVGSLIAKSALGSLAMRGVYQASAMTVAGSLLDGQVPNLNDFVRSAAVIVPLNLLTGGMLMKGKDAQQAMMDEFTETGRTPKDQEERLAAQPVVKDDLPPGLRAAIDTGSGFVDGDYAEHHADIASRVLAQKPVEINELEADPALADKVLESPSIQEQDVLDRAWGIKMESAEPPTGEPPKSGRGFVTPDGKFLSREEAPSWVKENEPDVHKMWSGIAGKDDAEFHSGDYQEARQRVSGRNLAEGEEDYSGMSSDVAQSISAFRSDLNPAKAGLKSAGYGEAVRNFFVGARNSFRAEGEQVVSRLRKLVTDPIDRRAISFMRDYRDDPELLRSEIEKVRAGSNEKLKEFIPSMERALNPSAEMMQADGEMTAYFTKALNLGRQVGTLESSIDPSRYSPRFFAKAMQDAQEGRGTGRPQFTERTAHAIKRNHLHLLDPLMSGDFEARTFDAFDELSVYSDRHAVSVATKMVTTELKNSELGKWGSGNKVPEGWVELAHEFRQTRMIVDSLSGESLTVSKNLYVPKVIADAMRPLFEDRPNQLAKVLHVQSAVKMMELSLSFFHMKALTVTAMNNMGFTEFARALKSDNNSPVFEEVERRAALHGVMTTKTGTPFEAYRGLQPGKAETRFSSLKDNAIVKRVDALAKGLTQETFDVIQRKFKVMDWSAKEAAWVAKHPQATDAEYASAMRGYAKEVNAAYGGLNWDAMGVSRGLQDVSRLFLLAPDWTFSNVLNLKYSGEGGVAGSAARAFFVKSFATGFAMTAAMSYAIGGKWDKDHPEMVYLGKDKDGKEMYANYFFAGAPKDAITLTHRVMKDGPLTGVAEFMVGKAGPLVGSGLGLAMNKEYSGKPISKKGESGEEKSKHQAEFVAGKVVPIIGTNVIKTVKDALTDPEHKYSYRDILELAADTIGSQTVHIADKEHAAAPERMLSSKPTRRKRFSIVENR